jgi:hypothetical protein
MYTHSTEFWSFGRRKFSLRKFSEEAFGRLADNELGVLYYFRTLCGRNDRD